MTKKPTFIREYIVNGSEVNYCIPSTPEQFMEYFQGYFEDVPKQFRVDTRITLEAAPDYDSAGLYLTVSYLRPETDTERKGRLYRDADAVQAREKHERSELKRLKEKYDD